jgi:hypothetical protein
VRVHQIDRASGHRCACASFILGERLGKFVRLYEQQALDQQVLQIVDGESMSPDPVGLPGLARQEADQPNPVAGCSGA